MYVRNREPSVDDILNDPLTRLVMARDGLSDEAMRAMIADARRRLSAKRAPSSSAAPVAMETT